MHSKWMFAVAALAISGPGYGATATLEADRMLAVEGRRVFVLGLYENPEDDAALDAAVQAGFNLIQTRGDVEGLDRLQRHGVHAWLNTGMSIDLSQDRDRREAALRDSVERLAGHPALLIWEVPDEALWNCWYEANLWRRRDEPQQQAQKIDALTDSALAERLREDQARVRALLEEGAFEEAEALANGIWRELGEDPPHPDLNYSNAHQRAVTMAGGIREGYDLLRRLDPAHPVWMNHAPRNRIEDLALFGEAADIVGCDIYPVTEYVTGHSDLADKSLASVGAYTERMQASAPGKPVWMVLQGFGWQDIQDIRDPFELARMKRPTLPQTRFMAYDAVVRGARGILYWGTAYIEKDSELWQDLLTLAAEFKTLQPVLSAPDSPQQPGVSIAPTWGSIDRGPVVLAKDVDDRTWFIVVNEWREPLTWRMTGLEGLAGASYRDTATGRTFRVGSDGAMEITLRGQGVLVLEPQP